MTESTLRDPLVALAELARIDLSIVTLPEVLERIAELTRSMLPGVADVSVTLMERDVPSTAARTSRRALELDEFQYAAGEGPCLDAAQEGGVMTIVDTSVPNTRWNEFAVAARATGISSTIAVGMSVRERVVGALNVYLDRSGGLDDVETELLTTFAAYATVALSNAHLQSATSALARQMELAMQSRAVIEQAKGIVMAQRGMGAEEAFAVLSRASQNMNRKLRDVAQSVVSGTERPPSGLPR